MSSVVVDVMNTVSAQWIAATPADRVNVSFHEIDGNEVEEGPTGHRGFMWRPPVRLTPVAVMPDGVASIVEYEITADLYVENTGRGRSGAVDALVNDCNLLCRVVEAQQFALPANCLFLDTDDPAVGEPQLLEDDSGAIAPIRLRMRVAETDG